MVVVQWTVTFDQSQWGESILVVGSFNDWNLCSAVRMSTDDKSFPCWTAVADIDALYFSMPLEYKYVIERADGSVAWETKQGNRVFEGLCGEGDGTMTTRRVDGLVAFENRSFPVSDHSTFTSSPKDHPNDFSVRIEGCIGNKNDSQIAPNDRSNVTVSRIIGEGPIIGSSPLTSLGSAEKSDETDSTLRSSHSDECEHLENDVVKLVQNNVDVDAEVVEEVKNFGRHDEQNQVVERDEPVVEAVARSGIPISGDEMDVNVDQKADCEFSVCITAGPARYGATGLDNDVSRSESNGDGVDPIGNMARIARRLFISVHDFSRKVFRKLTKAVRGLCGLFRR